MNADFEMELAHFAEMEFSAKRGLYRRPPGFEPINRRLAEKLLWLAAPGDALLIEEPWEESLIAGARNREVELVSGKDIERTRGRLFSPWGWTPSADRIGNTLEAVVERPELEVVSRVNSKLWSFALERELGVAIPGSDVAATFEALAEAVTMACPHPQDKWVIKSAYGFAARDRVLGRGPVIDYPQAKWARRRFERGEALLFQPWLKVEREYGVVMELKADGSSNIIGISDLQTNGAGTGTGYLLGRKVDAERLRQLETVAGRVAHQLFVAGYYGPIGMDALEHSGGLLPLLEINARYTMGFIALAVEKAWAPAAPVFWSTK
jgi:hypothetical protein